MNVSFDDGGMQGALENLGRIDPGRAVTASAFALAKRAKQLTPRGEGALAKRAKQLTPRGESALVNSIRTEVNGGTGTVGYLAEYAPHVEYGHRQNVGQYVPDLGKRLKAKYVEGQHFFRRAVTETKADLAKELRLALEEAEK